MGQVFNIVGYHLELRDQYTNKFIGSMQFDPADSDRPHGYSGRGLQYCKGTATKTGKSFPVDGYYVTEIIPICGKIIGDTLQERINLIKDHYQKQPYGKQRKG